MDHRRGRGRGSGPVGRSREWITGGGGEGGVVLWGDQDSGSQEGEGEGQGEWSCGEIKRVDHRRGRGRESGPVGGSREEE